jgi:hypothetical protein
MGIPHLTRFLRPYAVSGPLSGQEAVIDGPAFAYHIYHILLSSRQSSRNQLEAAISYDEIGNATISWLKALQESRVTV